MRVAADHERNALRVKHASILGHPCCVDIGAVAAPAVSPGDEIVRAVECNRGVLTVKRKCANLDPCRVEVGTAGRDPRGDYRFGLVPIIGPRNQVVRTVKRGRRPDLGIDSCPADADAVGIKHAHLTGQPGAVDVNASVAVIVPHCEIPAPIEGDGRILCKALRRLTHPHPRRVERYARARDPAGQDAIDRRPGLPGHEEVGPVVERGRTLIGINCRCERDTGINYASVRSDQGAAQATGEVLPDDKGISAVGTRCRTEQNVNTGRAIDHKR